jgi:predicted HicB family RNase H-like nuclease
MKEQKQIFIRVTPEMHKSVAIMAIEHGVTRVSLIIKAIEQYLKKHQKWHPSKKDD